MIQGIIFIVGIALVIFLCALLIVKDKGPVKLKVTKVDKIILIAAGAFIVLSIIFFNVGYRVLIIVADKKVESDFYENLISQGDYSYENGVCFKNDELIIGIWDDKNLDSIRNSMESSYNAKLYPRPNYSDYMLIFNSRQSYSELNRIREEMLGRYNLTYATIKTEEYGHRQEYRETHRQYQSKERIIKECFQDIFAK
jgi:hypothetical protein